MNWGIMENNVVASRRQLMFGAATAAVALPFIKSPLFAQTTGGSYYSTLVGSYTPYYPVTWADKNNWKVGAGSTWNTGMDHSVRMSSAKKRLRVELRNTEKDKADGDKTGCRRAELKGSVTKLYNSIEYWGAFSFIHHPWSDPAGMAKKTGGVHGQLHMGDHGGSPAVAFRRHKNGNFRVTTRGQYNSDGTVRYDKPLSFGAAHDLVYRVKFHPTAGELQVWLDGVKIVDVRGVSIGSNVAGYHWNIGAYYSGGITCPVVAEYANHVHPRVGSLSSRVTSRPAWPAD